MFKEEPNFSPELGQIFLSNNAFFAEEAYWATEGLVMLDRVIEESKIRNWTNDIKYEGTVFAYRPYCWCDGDLEGHEEQCPPNFEFYPTGIQISWYKHEARGITANVKELPAMTWWNVLNECVNEIKNYPFD